MLLVDDEVALREILAKWLVTVGCGHVLTAENGKVALEVLKTQHVDVLITDVRMPVMDGVALVRSLGELRRPIPSIVFVSEFADVDRREMYALGVEAFISKPFERRDLMAVLVRAAAERDTLWLTPMTVAPRQTLTILDGVEDGPPALRLGRGGFSARSSQSLSLTKVSFSCEMKEMVLRGQGLVRWYSRVDRTVGIEFVFVEESCRARVVEEIRALQPAEFIPIL